MESESEESERSHFFRLRLYDLEKTRLTESQAEAEG